MTRFARIFLVGLLLASAACARASAAGGDSAVDFSQQRIRITLPTEPPNLNSLLATDNISGFVLGHIMEGLLQYNEHNELAAGAAERWQLRSDGATFWLRRNARWSDGKPVTAHDFVFAWRRALLPATASQYAWILFPLRNAERINRGELPPEQLGVRAVGERQLEVSFERPCPYFLGLTAFPTYFPIREDFFAQRGERYAADADDLLYNGAFTLSRWVHGAQLTLRKNGMYWNAGHVHLREIDMPYITGDPTAAFKRWRNSARKPCPTRWRRDCR
jgi:oligopeptide transport system substrate-binding protein